MSRLNDEEVRLVLDALDLAIQDQEQYERHGCPEDDLDGDEEGLKALRERPEKWAALGERLSKERYDGKPDSEEKKFLRCIARMVKDGELYGDGSVFDMLGEDAVGTLHLIIDRARELTGLPPRDEDPLSSHENARHSR